MLTKNLFDFINKKISTQSFQEIIKIEVFHYGKAKLKKGSSLSILSDSYELESFTKEDLIKLFNFYIQGEIDEIQLEYILNWLELKDYEYESIVEKVIFFLSTSEINYQITPKNVEKAIRFLKGLDKELLLK